MDCFVASQSTPACSTSLCAVRCSLLSTAVSPSLSAEPVLIESLVAALEAAYAFQTNERANSSTIASVAPGHPRAPSAIALESNKQ
jgi:hypothetical protein